MKYAPKVLSGATYKDGKVRLAIGLTGLKSQPVEFAELTEKETLAHIRALCSILIALHNRG